MKLSKLIEVLQTHAEEMGDTEVKVILGDYEEAVSVDDVDFCVTYELDENGRANSYSKSVNHVHILLDEESRMNEDRWIAEKAIEEGNADVSARSSDPTSFCPNCGHDKGTCCSWFNHSFKFRCAKCNHSWIVKEEEIGPIKEG